ncbi:MAG: sugar transferase [Anaerolineales bacterium]|nr:sugar transferase [Anaerolineales bacterium]
MNRSLWLLVLIDIALINLAFGLAYYARYTLQLFAPVLDAFQAPFTAYAQLQIGYTVLMLIFLFVAGVYTPQRGVSWFAELYRIINASTTVGVIVFAIIFLSRTLIYSRLMILWAIGLTIVLLALARLVERAARRELRRRGIGVARVLFVCAGEMGRTVVLTMKARRDLGFQIVGFIDDDPSKGELGRLKNMGGLERVEHILSTEPVDEVLITLPWMYQRKIVALVRACQSFGVRARVVPDLFQLSLSRLDVDDLGGIPIIGIKEVRISRIGRLFKRALDVTFAVLGLLISSPLMLLAALAIKLDSPGSVFFRQTRVGEHGKLFTVYKFRSMRESAEEELGQLLAFNEASGPLFKMKDDPRRTRVGTILRTTSLDELPQFFNILRGDMSLVGPRPGLPSEVEQYQPWHRQRLEVQPGLSGLWQVSGRSDLTFDEMCLLDIYYIENWSLALDFVVMFRTIPRVLFGSGAY